MSPLERCLKKCRRTKRTRRRGRRSTTRRRPRDSRGRFIKRRASWNSDSMGRIVPRSPRRSPRNTYAIPRSPRRSPRKTYASYAQRDARGRLLPKTGKSRKMMSCGRYWKAFRSRFKVRIDDWRRVSVFHEFDTGNKWRRHFVWLCTLETQL